MWVAITGGIGTGKSTVSDIIRTKGYTVLDADELARKVVEVGQPAYQEIVKTFGKEILSNDGSIDRLKLGTIIFSDIKKRELLEKITHPRIREICIRLRDEKFAQGEKVVFYDVPLLFEKNLQDEFDHIIAVITTPTLQRERLQKRNRWNDEEIKNRMSAQLSLEEKAKRADSVVENNGTKKDLEKMVNEVLSRL